MTQKRKTKINNLQRQGEYSKLIDFINLVVKQESDPNLIMHYEIIQLEAYFNLRKFDIVKKRAEELIFELQNCTPSHKGEIENILGKVYRIHQRYPEALKHYSFAEKAFKESQDVQGLIKVNMNMGNVHIFQERFKEAKKLHLKALKLAETTRNYNLLGNCYLNLGSLYYQYGEIDNALKYYREAEAIFNQLNDIPSLAAVHNNLGEIFFIRRNFIQSSSHSNKALGYYKKENNVLGELIASKAYAKAEKALNHFEEAIKTYENILALQKEGKTEDVLLELADCYLSVNKLKKAEKTYKVLLNESNYTQESIAHALNSLALISIEKKDYIQAISCYSRLSILLEDLNPVDNDSLAATRGNLGYAYLKSGNKPKAIRYFEMAIIYFVKQKLQEEAMTLSKNFIYELTRDNDFQSGISVLINFSIPFAESVKNRTLKTKMVYEVAFLYHLAGQTSQGVKYWQKNGSERPFSQIKPDFLNNKELTSKNRQYLEVEHRKFRQIFLKLA